MGHTIPVSWGQKGCLRAWGPRLSGWGSMDILNMDFVLPRAAKKHGANFPVPSVLVISGEATDPKQGIRALQILITLARLGMTTINSKVKICACCGGEATVYELNSTSSFGSPDLDLRSPQPERGTIDMWVQLCPTCGYCAPNLSEAPANAKEIIQSVEYRDLGKSSLPGLSINFRRWALIADASGDSLDAAHALMHAAWAADDAGRMAAECRVVAAKRFVALKSQGGWPGTDAGVIEAVTTDLWRRAGCWNEAEKAANDGVAEGAASFVKQVLEFELTLIERRDTGCHTVREAVDAMA